jgi:RHS repeat-associated protein
MNGVSVPKTIFPGDYTYDGSPVVMNAWATLSSGASIVATTTVSFTEQTSVASLTCGTPQVQCVSYLYDADGNITRVIDKSATTAAKTMDYTYDPLNRLISASSSNATNGKNYLQTYAYDPVGNLLTKSDEGTYSYAGNQGGSFANPHAVTSITNGTTTTQFAYDNNGNLTGVAGGTTASTYTWDYLNRLVSASSSSSSSPASSYGYDFTGQRVLVQNGTSTTSYPEMTYNTDGTTPVKHIFAGGTLVATITGTSTSTAAASVRYVLDDTLGGSNVVTDSSGTVVETLDYYPYGATRIDNLANGAISEQRKFIGQEYDAATSLSYLNARYYDGGRGQFVSEDPVFWGDPAQQNLKNPQDLNSYSYADDNPIVHEDPTGKQAATLASQLQQLYSALTALSATIAAAGNSAALTAAMPMIGITLGTVGATIGVIALANRTTVVTVSTASNFQSTNAFGPGIVSTPSIGSSQGGTLAFPIENPSSLNQPYSFSKQITGSAPKSVPSGTKRINEVGLDKDTLHEVKEGLRAGPQDYVGVTPNGDVITTGPGGEAENNGPIDNYTHRPTGLVK